MKLNDILTEAPNKDTQLAFDILYSRAIEIPRNEDGFPTVGYAEAWRELFEMDQDFGINLDKVDWELVHREFYN